MKKLFLGVLMAALLVPFVSFAETADSIKARLQEITSQKESLQQQLIDLNREERDLRLKLNKAQHEEVMMTEETEVMDAMEEPKGEMTTSFGAPTITEPMDGMIIPLSESMVTIKGTAPEGAQKIIVNGYTLTKFYPGNKTWIYYAAPKYGTMTEGPNYYTAVAVDKNGNQTVSNEVALYYGEPPLEEMITEEELMKMQQGASEEKEMGTLTTQRTYPYRSQVTNPAWESSDYSTLDREEFSGNLERVQEQQKRANEKLMRYRSIK